MKIVTNGTTEKKTQRKPEKTLKRNPEAKCMVCTWLKNLTISIFKLRVGDSISTLVGPSVRP